MFEMTEIISTDENKYPISDSFNKLMKNGYTCILNKNGKQISQPMEDKFHYRCIKTPYIVDPSDNDDDLFWR